MVRLAAGRFRLVGTVSVAYGCPFEGKVDPGVVAEDVARFVSLGVAHVALGDTTGLATPKSVAAMAGRTPRAATLIAHFHDTRGTGLVNCVAAYDAGIRFFDASFGGVGGHPAKVEYGGGHTGNVCTEDLVNLLESMGIGTGVDLDGLLDTARFCEQVLGRELHGRVTRSGLSR
jgi:hydroxymethylglutaryl-CoA lyase